LAFRSTIRELVDSRQNSFPTCDAVPDNSRNCV